VARGDFFYTIQVFRGGEFFAGRCLQRIGPGRRAVDEMRTGWRTLVYSRSFTHVANQYYDTLTASCWCRANTVSMTGSLHFSPSSLAYIRRTKRPPPLAYLLWRTLLKKSTQATQLLKDSDRSSIRFCVAFAALRTLRTVA